MEVTEIQATSILTPQKVGSLAGHYTYSLNPYAGCAFRCSYCYVPKFPSKRHDDFAKWGKWLEVKVNAPELIRKERTRVFGSSIFFSSATDPYQYIELKYRLSRRCLKELLKYRPAKLTMHTRSHLILQDADLLKQFGDVVRVGVSITTDDEKIQREFEPGAPSIARRLELLAGLKEAGIRIHASLSPLLPCNPERLASQLKPFVDTIWIDSMRYPEINNRKDLLEKHAEFFEPTAYNRVQEWLYKEITNKSAKPKSAARRSAHEYTAKTQRADHTEMSGRRSIQSSDLTSTRTPDRVSKGRKNESDAQQLRLLLTNV
jgi:DNA repair photolyase